MSASASEIVSGVGACMYVAVIIRCALYVHCCEYTICLVCALLWLCVVPCMY